MTRKLCEGGAVVALARVRRLTKPLDDRASKVVGVATTLSYLKGWNTLPSLIFSSQSNAIEA
jgi:hypothetical protein